MNDEVRGTGRTTGLMLRAIGDALLDPGGEVEFCDHEPHTYTSARMAHIAIDQMAATLGLAVAVHRVGSRVFIISARVKA